MVDAITYQECSAAHIIGRLDVKDLTKIEQHKGNVEITYCLGAISQTILSSFRARGESHTKFTGVLLANWTSHISPIICNELVKYINKLGLDVFLEIGPPHFLSDAQVRELDMELIRGIVVRNGTILPDGQRRNYFEMNEMRPALRAMAAQGCVRDASIIMWEVLDDSAEVVHAVVKRSYDWCRFKSAISWIGPNAALTDAEIAYTKTIDGEPMGAMMWLKEDDTMKLHETWRLNDKVSS